MILCLSRIVTYKASMTLGLRDLIISHNYGIMTVLPLKCPHHYNARIGICLIVILPQCSCQKMNALLVKFLWIVAFFIMWVRKDTHIAIEHCSCFLFIYLSCIYLLGTDLNVKGMWLRTNDHHLNEETWNKYIRQIQFPPSHSKTHRFIDMAQSTKSFPPHLGSHLPKEAWCIQPCPCLPKGVLTFQKRHETFGHLFHTFPKRHSTFSHVFSFLMRFLLFNWSCCLPNKAKRIWPYPANVFSYTWRHDTLDHLAFWGHIRLPQSLPRN